MERIRKIGGLGMIILNVLLSQSCSKNEPIERNGFITIKIDGVAVDMPYHSKMTEKESGTWNLNALTEGEGNDLEGRQSFTVNIRDLEDGVLKERSYSLDNGTAAISAQFTEHLPNNAENHHWTASSSSALPGDSFTIHFTSISGDRAEGTFSGTLLVSSVGQIQKFRKITEGKFSLPIY